MRISLLWEKRYIRPKSSILLKDKTLDKVSWELQIKGWLPFNIVLELLNDVIKWVKETGGLNSEKKVWKLSLFAKDIIIYLKNSRESIF